MMSRSYALRALPLLFGSVVLALAAPACAGLGRPIASLETDRVQLGATLKSTASGAYTVHTLSLANGGAVKEFTRADGTVFAVAWRAPGRPDLRTLLGDHFDTLQTESAARVGRHARRPLGVNRSDLVVQSGGHSGAFWGAAVLPQMQPAGFSAGDLK